MSSRTVGYQWYCIQSGKEWATDSVIGLGLIWRTGSRREGTQTGWYLKGGPNDGEWLGRHFGNALALAWGLGQENGVAAPAPVKVSPKMHDELILAANTYQNARGVVAWCGRRTEDALIRRGLITYDTHQPDNFPVITVKGWEYLASTGYKRRAEDFGRLTLDQALAEAYPEPAAKVAEPARWVVGDRVAGQVKGQPFTGRVTNTHFKGEVLDVVHVAADQTLTTPAGRTVGRVILRGSGEIAGLSPEPATEAAAEQVPADPELRAEIADLRTILALIRNSNCTPGQWGEVRAAVTAARDRFIQVDNARRTGQEPVPAEPRPDNARAHVTEALAVLREELPNLAKTNPYAADAVRTLDAAGVFQLIDPER